MEGGFSHMNFEKGHCSPVALKKDCSYSCLDDKLIKKIAKIVNKKHQGSINTNTSANEIHEQLSKLLTLNTTCDKESCWLNIHNIMSNLSKKEKNKFIDSFKPQMPESWLSDYKTWLRTSDIEKCIYQYSKAFKDFYFYGAEPIDFRKCSVSPLCKFSLLKHMIKGHNRIGIVFNTDEHDGDGEHWIAMYIDVKGKNLNKIPGIYYFDSYGEKEPEEVTTFVKKVKKQGKKLGLDIKYFYNDHSHQVRNNQCGMYCINFIIKMLSNVNFKYFNTENPELTDDKMIEKRDEYFIKPIKVDF